MRLFRYFVLRALLAVVGSMSGVRAQEQKAAAQKAPKDAAAGEWVSLFDGRTLGSWAQTEFEFVGGVKVEAPFRGGPGAIIIEKGTTLSGITWKNGAALPRTNYEITLEAMKLEGSDFFCGLTFPVGKDACTFIVGGWSGMVVGISSIDDMDASENDTTDGMEFADNRWYRIRVRVTPEKIEAWIGEKQMVDFELRGRKISMRPGDIEKSQPLGIATYMTRAAVRDIRMRKL
ncbi:MAG TPA: DUF1080 domain-containing protein [Opitutaceae bacterium]|nr:DUF1080 domain-containing protein [Opitutaceae bacterium]